MAVASVAALETSLKRVFLPGRVERINYERHPILAMMPKNQRFYGFDQAYVVNIEDPQTVSNTFSDALAETENTDYQRFIPTRARIYSVVRLDNDLIRASEADIGSFVRHKTEEVAGKLAATSRRMAQQIVNGDGSGRIGTTSAAITTTTITLTDPELVVFWANNMVIEASADDGTSSAHTLLAGTAKVTQVDRGTGVITIDALPAAWNGSADNFFPVGTFRAAFQGLNAWFPAAEPTSGDSFYSNTNRHTDPVRLSGVRFDGGTTPAATGLSLASKVTKFRARMKREGGMAPDYYFVNDDRWAELEDELESRKRIVEGGAKSSGKGNIAFDYISVGGARVVADHNVGSEVMWAGSMKYLTLSSLGPLPGFLTEQKFLVEPSSDGYQVRLGGYGNLICTAPGYWGRADLDA